MVTTSAVATWATRKLRALLVMRAMKNSIAQGRVKLNDAYPALLTCASQGMGVRPVNAVSLTPGSRTPGS